MIVKSFKQLQDDALRWFDESTNDSELRENVKQALNAAHVTRLASRNWPFMKYPVDASFDTVVGQKVYSLHPEFYRPVYFYNTTAKQYLRQVNDSTLVGHREQDSVDRFLGDVGVNLNRAAYRFELKGTSFVQQQPESGTTLTVGSSSTSDGTSVGLKIRGETTDGSVTEEEIMCLAAGGERTGSVAFTRILRVTKVGTWVGTATLKASINADVLVKLAANEPAKIYQTLVLLAEPTAVETVEYPFYRQPSPLEDDNDVPDIPPPFQDILVYDALIDLATYNEVEKNAVGIWTLRQGKLEEGLIETYGEALALEREPSYIEYLGN